MSRLLSIDHFLKLLFGALVVLCALFASQTALAQPCNDGGGETTVSEAADEAPCTAPCQGESDEDDDCTDDCQFCSCCSMAAPAALMSVSVGAGFDVLAYRGDMPLPSSSQHGGVSLRVFKPPRLV